LYKNVAFLFAIKIGLSRVGIWTPSTTWFLGPIWVHIPKMASRSV